MVGVYLCFFTGHLTFESNFFNSYSPEAIGIHTELSCSLGMEGENRKTCPRDFEVFHCKYWELCSQFIMDPTQLVGIPFEEGEGKVMPIDRNVN